MVPFEGVVRKEVGYKDALASKKYATTATYSVCRWFSIVVVGVGRGCRAHLVVPPLPLLLPPPRPPRLLLLLLLLRPPLLLLLPLFLQPKNNCLLCKLINAKQLHIKYWYSCIMKVHMYKENYINNNFFSQYSYSTLSCGQNAQYAVQNFQW